MGRIPVGRLVTGVTYYSLPNAAWDRPPGLHDLDYGLDLELGSDVFGIAWSLKGGTLDVVQGSLQSELPTAVRSDASSVEPWADVVGSRLARVGDADPSILHLTAGSGRQIWLVAGNYLDDLDGVMVGGDSVLVVHDIDAARRWGLG